MSRVPGRVIHKSIDISRPTHNLTPIRPRVSGSPPRVSIPKPKFHTNSFLDSSSHTSLPKTAGKNRQASPYAQASHVRGGSKGKFEGPRMRASSPMIKKISSELSFPQQKPPYGPPAGHYYHNSEAHNASAISLTEAPLRPKTLNTSTSIPANLSVSFTNSFNTFATESPKAAGTKNKEVAQLEFKLTERLKETESGEKLNVYAEIFQDAIRLDKPFGPLLAKIKSAYDESLSQRSEKLEIEKLKEQLQEVERHLEVEKDERKFALKKLEKISKENLEISRSLDERENDCMELQEKLYQISQIDTQEMPKDEQSWQFLLSENKSYQDLFGRMDKDIKNFKKREKKLLKLLLALKRRGYPVDEVYEEEVHKVKKPQPQVEISEEVEESEAEAIVQGPPKNVPRPEAVPPLRLSEVEPESDSDSDPVDSSASSISLPGPKKREQEGQPNPQSNGTKSSVDSSKVRGQVPALSIPPGQENGFHQEFLAKIDEFSESWRRQIQSDHRSVVP